MASTVDPQPAGIPTRGVLPTPELVRDGVARLLDEVDSVLSSTRWEFERGGSDHTTWLLYDAAALRHCCRLLFEIQHAADAELELAVRTLWRNHTESWLVAMYIHFGGYPALQCIVQGSRRNFEALEHDREGFVQKLAADKKAARASASKVKQINTGIKKWNAANPKAPRKPLRTVPHIPQLAPRDPGLNNIIDLYGAPDGQAISVSDMVDLLTKLGPEKGFSLESLRPIYHIYRMQSATGAHPTATVLDSYLDPCETWRTVPALVTPAVRSFALPGALQATAFLSSRILGVQGSPTPVFDGLHLWLAPELDGSAPWASNK